MSTADVPAAALDEPSLTQVANRGFVDGCAE
jgi:hypothetical protein